MADGKNKKEYDGRKVRSSINAITKSAKVRIISKKIFKNLGIFILCSKEFSFFIILLLNFAYNYKLN